MTGHAENRAVPCSQNPWGVGPDTHALWCRRGGSGESTEQAHQQELHVRRWQSDCGGGAGSGEREGAGRGVPDASAPTLQTLVQDSIRRHALHRRAAYKALPNHGAVKHGVGEYVQEQVHIKMESFWAA